MVGGQLRIGRECRGRILKQLTGIVVKEMERESYQRLY